jgi:hypothetical protein
LLVGERSESRLGEQLMGPIARFLPARYRAITSACVARALVRLALAPPGKSPRRVVLSDELQILGG